MKTHIYSTSMELYKVSTECKGCSEISQNQLPCSMVVVYIQLVQKLFTIDWQRSALFLKPGSESDLDEVAQYRTEPRGGRNSPTLCTTLGFASRCLDRIPTWLFAVFSVCSA